jgi:hypothetical protein
MEVNTTEEGKKYEVVGEEAVMEDMDYAKLKNKFIKPKKMVEGQTVPELSSDEELRAKFSTVKKPNKSVNDGAKRSSNKN